MAFVGDVHGDGYDDVIITELYASTPVLNMGKVHMWCGSATGPVANWTETGGFANALLGYTVSPAGDINEDGYDDFFMMYPSCLSLEQSIFTLVQRMGHALIPNYQFRERLKRTSD